MIAIEEDALFIADSHYPHHGDAFLVLLLAIERGSISVPQVFLMGDNFDLLFGHNSYILEKNQQVITLLLTLSHSIDFYYFEGNHDFCLANIFVDMKVYSRDAQPIVFALGTQKVALSHGDKYATGWGYNLYCLLLRNRFTLTLLAPFQQMIIDHRLGKLSQKKICDTFYTFEKRVSQILASYDKVEKVDWVIEGHFHQGRILGKYISLPSQACQNKIGIVKEDKIVFQTLSF
ncbi:MAG: UDP-2,3-diacylglucosamine diphosphatase [Sulfurovum sp.]|nr:UDP-2,3-diacylglucosamine diphosphatase [Sulfurovum sp.]